MKALGGLAEFRAVIDQGGFTGAAEALGIPQLFVSPRVPDLDPVKLIRCRSGNRRTLRFAALDQRLSPEIAGQVTGLSADVWSTRLPV